MDYATFIFDYHKARADKIGDCVDMTTESTERYCRDVTRAIEYSDRMNAITTRDN